MKAWMNDRDGWNVIAVSGDLRNQYVSAGCSVFSTQHTIEEDKLWRPPLAIASVQIS
jgi:hypothetical protein